MGIYYSLEKLGFGVHVLATHQGRVKDRLLVAFQQGLYAVGPASLPGQARTIWEGVWREVTAIKACGEAGSFKPSIAALAEEQASGLPEKIWTVHSLTRWQAASS